MDLLLPDAPSEKVKSLFSDVYTPVIPNMANHGWGQATELATNEIAPCDFIHKAKISNLHLILLQIIQLTMCLI